VIAGATEQGRTGNVRNVDERPSNKNLGESPAESRQRAATEGKQTVEQNRNKATMVPNDRTKQTTTNKGAKVEFRAQDSAKNEQCTPCEKDFTHGVHKTVRAA